MMRNLLNWSRLSRSTHRVHPWHPASTWSVWPPQSGWPFQGCPLGPLSGQSYGSAREQPQGPLKDTKDSTNQLHDFLLRKTRFCWLLIKFVTYEYSIFVDDEHVVNGLSIGEGARSGSWHSIRKNLLDVLSDHACHRHPHIWDKIASLGLTF